MTLDVNRVVATAIDAAFENGHDDRRRHRLSGAGAIATGLALATVARAATQKKLPRIAKFGMQKLVDAPRFREVSDRVRDRLADVGLIHENEPAERDRYEDEEWDDSDDFEERDEQPETEADEDWEDEDEQPDAEADEDWEEEDEDDRPRGDEDDDQPRGEDDGNQGREPDEDWEDEEDDEREDEPEAPRLERTSRSGAGAESGDVAARMGPPDLMPMLSGHRSPPPALARARRREPLRRPPAPAPRDRTDQESKSKSDSKSKSKSGSKSKAPAGRKRAAGRN